MHFYNTELAIRSLRLTMPSFISSCSSVDPFAIWRLTQSVPGLIFNINIMSLLAKWLGTWLRVIISLSVGNISGAL